jgi:hypothetical protein
MAEEGGQSGLSGFRQMSDGLVRRRDSKSFGNVLARTRRESPARR